MTRQLQRWVRSPQPGELPQAAEELIQHLQRYLRGRYASGSAPSSGTKRLVQEVAELLADAVGPALPVDPSTAAALLNVSVRVVPATAGGTLGKLIPVAGGFEAQIFERQSRAGPADAGSSANDGVHRFLTKRGRFTLAHELGHVLFFTRPKHGVVPGRLTPAGVSREDRWREEGLCHEFARALLLPSFARPMIPDDPTPQAVLAGTAAFRVSAEVLVRRVLHDWSLWPDTSFILVTTVSTRPKTQIFHGVMSPFKTKRAADHSQRVRMLEETASSGRVIAAVEEVFGCARSNILASRDTVWGILK